MRTRGAAATGHAASDHGLPHDGAPDGLAPNDRAPDDITPNGGAPDAGALAPLAWAVRALDAARTTRLRLQSRVAHGLAARSGIAATDGSWRLARALVAMSRDADDDPHALLGRFYRLARAEERASRATVRELVRAHPAWPWLQRVPGVGEIAAARLLARLDLARARTPSSFVAHCGVATAPATRYACAACGAELVWLTWSPPRAHRTPDGAPCGGRLVPVSRAGRMARPTAGRGLRSQGDPAARTALHLLATSLVRSHPLYRDYYAAHLARQEARHADWPPRRRHLTAMRAVEQLFLHHLWVAWRWALGLPSVGAYSETRLGLRALPPPEAAASRA